MSKSTVSPTELDETTLEAEDLSTSQETVPLPYLAGTRKVGLRWLDGSLALIAELAPDESPKK